MAYIFKNTLLVASRSDDKKLRKQENKKKMKYVSKTRIVS